MRTDAIRRAARVPFVRSTLALALLAAAAPACAEFTVISMPDTQNYTDDASLNRFFYDQTNWIVANQAALNIRFVNHLGDLVQNAANAPEWTVAKTAMGTLDAADIPYGQLAGNHDILYPGDFTDYAGVNYRARFGPQFYAGRPWYRGASPSELSNYQIIEVDGQEYLFLNMVVETPAAELKWAQEEVLNKHQDKPTLVSTHRYLYDWTLDGAFPFIGAGRYDDFNYFFEPPYRPDGVQANTLFRNFIAANRQIYMVYCGHNHTEGYRQVSTNNFGFPVHEVLADYQDFDNGGNGYLRINHFQPENDRILVTSYSPTLNSNLTGDRSVFTLNVDFDNYRLAGNEVLRTYRNGESGYEGTQDTWVNEASKNQNNGGSTLLTVDDDVNNCPGIFCIDEQDGQALIRFDALFRGPVYEGDLAPGEKPAQIPTNATITKANLVITLENDENVGDTTIGVYRMTRDWNEASNWNSLSGGLSSADYALPAVGTFQGDNNPDLDYTRTINVLSALNAWKGGQPNYGFGIVRPQTNFNDDGVDIFSSEHGNVFERPALSVEYTFPVLNRAPVVNATLSPAVLTVNEGESVVLSVTATDPNPSEFLQLQVNGVDIPNGFVVGSGQMQHEVLFEDDGSFGFTARVFDDETDVPAGSSTITVLNLPPVIDEAVLTDDLTADVNGAFNFDVVADDAGRFDVVTYAWDLDGDGQYDDSTSESGVWSFPGEGTYVVRVRASDDDGGVSEGTFTVTVEDLPATGDMNANGVAVDTVAQAWTDPADQALFAACASGQIGAPYTFANCLAAFDADNDGDVDSTDETALLTGLLPEPAPTRVPALPLAFIGALAGVLGLRGIRRL